MKKNTPPGAKLPQRSIPVADLDTTYADMVRAGTRDPLHVRRVQKGYEAKAKLPPVVVVTWPGGGWLLADGGYRVAAKKEGKGARIPAEVVECADEESARREALRIAVAANEHPGKPRSSDDLRAAIAAFITADWNADLSDHAAAKAINCHHVVVRRVRESLSADGTIREDSPAHFSNRVYKEGARIGGGYISDGKGGLLHQPPAPVPTPTDPPIIPAPADYDAPAPPGAQPPVTDPPAGEPDDAEPFDDATPPMPVPEPPAGPVVDGRGRLVPAPLAYLFDGTTDAYAVCPHVNDAGDHRQTDNPKQCLVCRGRFVLSAAQHAGLTDDLKNLCDGRDPAHDQRDDDRQRAEQIALDRLKRCQVLADQLTAAVGNLGNSSLGFDLMVAAGQERIPFVFPNAAPAGMGDVARTQLGRFWAWAPLATLSRVMTDVEAAYRRRVVDRTEVR